MKHLGSNRANLSPSILYKSQLVFIIFRFLFFDSVAVDASGLVCRHTSLDIIVDSVQFMTSRLCTKNQFAVFFLSKIEFGVFYSFSLLFHFILTVAVV